MQLSSDAHRALTALHEGAAELRAAAAASEATLSRSWTVLEEVDAEAWTAEAARAWSHIPAVLSARRDR